ncbi:helix-turn-helix domain-containing protein (plasmid) [Niallia taxi]|uniref:helix-turn-helix domain-containing protein n=1 Tax=Niallia taxi TaxID=2499688 RepID=UPI003F62742D
MSDINIDRKSLKEDWGRSFIQEEALFTSEAAELLGCSRQAIHKLVKKGMLVPVKDSGKERLFLRREIMHYKEFKENGYIK